MSRKITTAHIEEALFRYFDVKRNMIVPNIYWGLGFRHELDMIVCTPRGYCTEVEIKVSKSDIIADKKKRHNHYDERLKYLYFAVPKELEEYALLHIPHRAGLIVVSDKYGDGVLVPEKVRAAKAQKNASKLSDREIEQLLRLGCMRLHRWAKEKVRCLEAQK